MPDAVFPFPGGKSKLASWILDHVPEHTCFVEVFGGAAGVLVNKDPDTSDVEVYNDRDGDLVQFFEVLRDSADETVFYCDPPYVGKEDYYRVGGMDHSALVDRLRELKGTWLCSYEDLPEGMDEFNVIGRDEKYYLNSGKRGSAKRTREHLVTNRKPAAGSGE